MHVQGGVGKSIYASSWDVCALGFLIQMWLSGRKIRQESEVPCSQLWGEFILYSFLFSRARFKLLQRLGVPPNASTDWQNSDTGSQNWTGSLIVPGTCCSPALLPWGDFEAGMCRPGIIPLTEIDSHEWKTSTQREIHTQRYGCVPLNVFLPPK